MSRSSTGCHTKHKQQMCEINGTFDACKRGHQNCSCRCICLSLISDGPEFFWTCAPPDSLRGDSGPITKSDLERGFTSCVVFVITCELLNRLLMITVPLANEWRKWGKHGRPSSILPALFHDSSLCRDGSFSWDWSIRAFTLKVPPISMDMLMTVSPQLYAHHLFRYMLVCSNPVQLLSGMPAAATWWTAEQSGSRGSEVWSGIYSGEWKENWFQCWGRTSQVLWKHVELFKKMNSHWWWTNQWHTPTHSCRWVLSSVWRESQKKLDNLRLGK